LWLRLGFVAADLERAENRLRTATYELEQAREARQVLEAHFARERERAERLDDALEDILTGDFDNADTALDPRLRDALRRLRD
ncbi:MAG: hypothetical protein AAGJ91_10265, partial [Pseudomonadota bacterium]